MPVGRKGWVQVADGSVYANAVTLNKGDSLVVVGQAL
ncbi:hypothetical protein [Planktotalea arctica]